MNFAIKSTHWVRNNITKVKRHKSPLAFSLHLIKSRIVFVMGNNFPSLLPLSIFKYRRHNYYLHYAPNQFSQVLYTYPDIVRHPDDEEFLKAYLKPRDNYIDIGANIGTTTLCATTATSSRADPNKVIRSGVTIAYEAHPVTFTYLTRSILNNRELMPRIITRNVALGDSEGVVAFSTIINHDDINHVVPDDSTDPSSKADKHSKKKSIVHVPIMRLDDELTFPSIDLIKIDVEGYELQVFKGAKETLARTDAIFFEIYDKNTEIFNYKTNDIINLLLDNKFKIYKIDIVNKSLTRLDIHNYSGSPQCENMIAVRNEEDLCSRTGYIIST